ncbi:tellurite resistance TerB family protein [Paracoccus liaowanqingii]|uniref:Tellurite resistance TerB family protein n=2 Tax=Paracoccus liaowanqingii TaxID=2560053 RepID=A0A4P7HP77_9RHOB|nr:tellurite resistance TerB family protein [Paracoccus liaowanqingii]QBX35530.1 tellurite resistance TerB family protein [Paracoccus liaowanqingii]
MSLMKSLTKVAAGVMLAKGIGSMMNNQQQGGARARSGGGGLMDSLLGNNAGGAGTGIGSGAGGSGGGLGQMLGRALGGGSGASGRGSLGGLLDSLGGRGGVGRVSQGSSGGGLGQMLGGLLGGAAAGGAAGHLAQKDSQPSNQASFGALFDDALAHDGEPQVAPTPEQNEMAGLMLRAMIQAAKSDGTIDEAERKRLMGHLGDDLDEEERQFIRDQMAAPVDAAGLARDIPEGMERQVYLMSLLAIDFDSEAEARYLNDLAGAMKLDRAAVNEIHAEAGVMPLYNA